MADAWGNLTPIINNAEDELFWRRVRDSSAELMQQSAEQNLQEAIRQSQEAERARQGIMRTGQEAVVQNDYTVQPRPDPSIAPYSPRPNVSPVYQMKNEAAQVGHLSPEARTFLYDMPTDVRLDEDPNFAATYQPGRKWRAFLGPLWDRVPSGKGTMEINGGMDPLPTTLAHEGLHGWYFEKVPRDVRNQWRRDYPDQVQTQAWMPVLQQYSESQWPAESYAYGGQAGVYPGMSSQDAERYYPGWFDPNYLARRER